MKKIYGFITIVLAASVAMSSCTKENEAGNGSPSAGTRVLTVSFATDTKTTMGDDLKPEFVGGEWIMVANGAEKPEECQVTVTDGVATISTTLEGPLTALYPSYAAVVYGNDIVGFNVDQYQNGIFGDANICQATGADDADCLHFVNQTALLIITPPSGTKQFTIKSQGSRPVDINNNGSDPNSITVGDGRSSLGTYYVSILPGAKLSNLSFCTEDRTKVIPMADITAQATAQGKKSEEINITTEGTAYTISKKNWCVEDAVPSLFSVSASKQVNFSKGNLRAHKESDVWTWGFYDKQYQCNILKSNANREANASDTDIDLFTWGYGDWSADPVTTLYDTSSFTDWGTTIDDKGTWRTLTSAEWEYLVNKDGNDTVRKGKFKCGVTVCGQQKCMILAPDNFDGTIEDEYDESDWTYAEAEGLVCLPPAGCRFRTDVYFVGVYGYYRSSTADDITKANLLSFDGVEPFPGITFDSYYGFAVRLVTDSE